MDGWELIEHYLFPKISGGKIMTVTPASGGTRPATAAASVSVSEDDSDDSSY